MTLLSTTTFGKGKTVVERHLLQGPAGVYVRKRVIPAQDSYLGQRGVKAIAMDSDDKLIRVFNIEDDIALCGTPQEVRPLFELLKKLPNLIIKADS